MPALKKFSAAQEEDDQQFPNPEADRFNPEAEEEEEEEDPGNIDEKDEGEDKEVEHDVIRGEEEVVEEEDEAEAEDEKTLEEEDSKGRSQSYPSEEQLDSELSDGEIEMIRNSVQCPICLGIIKHTRTVMSCLHRFCRECINKSFRLGNNECPACREHCPSKRSLRDDPAFDALIAATFKNIERFEEEELAFHEDDEARKKEIQLSIAKVSQRQSEAVVKRKYTKKGAGVLQRSQRIGSGSRRRGNCRNKRQETAEAHDDNNNRGKDSSSDEACVELLQRKQRKCTTNRLTAHASSSSPNDNDDDDNNNNRGKDSSSDEPSAKLLQRKRRQRTPNRLTVHPSSSSPNNNVNCISNGTEEASHKDSGGVSPRPLRNLEILAWGRGGTRSNARQGNNNQGASIKSVRNARLNKLVEYLGSLESNGVEWDIHLKLVSLDTQCKPNLTQPNLCCRPSMLVKQLREYVALQMQLNAEEVDLLVSKGEHKETKDNNTSSSSTEKMQSLKDDETLAKFKIDRNEYLIVMYRQKQNG